MSAEKTFYFWENFCPIVLLQIKLETQLHFHGGIRKLCFWIQQKIKTLSFLSPVFTSSQANDPYKL